MIVRIAPVAALVLAFPLVACSGAADDELSEESGYAASAAKGDKDGDKKPGDDGSAGKPGGKPGEPGKVPSKPGDDAAGKDGKPGGKAPAADPACVVTCKAKLEAKCGGDGDFCADVCASADADLVGCMSAAPSCEKKEWLRCAAEEDEAPPAKK